mmetsp:Transcript_20718/g.48041  ORF Transcript_20718/g.48041 Transcript_20718/m.48041 type:complete len:183 (+) Transcript_20718:149-697(+)
MAYNEYSTPPPPPMPGVQWNHSTCCEIHSCCGERRSCCYDTCGCLDRGPMWLLRNALCLPCVFGRVAQVGAEYSSSTCCCVGFMVGAAAGGYFFGAPIFPCAMQVRRKLVAKYSIEETWCCSLLHIICCPGVSIAQMAMEVEDRERGAFQCGGKWAPIDKAGEYVTLPGEYATPVASVVIHR